MKQLAAARAVISIWTENSVRSDWVRAEAGRAKADGKLIPVKTSDVAYGDIPLPFGEMHTENVGSTDLIRAAVVAQLAKPAVEPSAVALLTKGFKWELLTWWGIIGGALTLFTAISAVLKLADWAQRLVEHWEEWTHAFWLWAFSWLGIHLPPQWTPILSFLLFWSLLAIGQAVKFKSTINTKIIADKYQGKSFQLSRMVVCLGLMLVILFLNAGFVLAWIGDWARYMASRPSPVYILLAAILMATVPLLLIVPFARYRLQAAISTALMLTFFTVITLAHLNLYTGPDLADVEVEGLTLFIVLVLAWISPLILLSIAPAKDVSRRLIFLAIGLLLLIALNELSKLGLDVTAPKHQG